MTLVKVFVRQLFRIRNSVQIIFTVWTECTFIGEIEETMSLSLFLQGVSLSVFISVNIVNGPFGICVADYGLLVTDNVYQTESFPPIILCGVLAK